MVYRAPRIARVARTSAARRARASLVASCALAVFTGKARAFGAPPRTRPERLRRATSRILARIAMPFSASARNDAPRLPRPARAFVDVWDHDAEGDAFVPPPPATLPASLRPKPSHDAWLLHELGAQKTHAAGPGLVRRGRHAPARDGSESPELRRARVRLAQLEPVLDDARRDARLADRARRTAEAERDRANAALEEMREEASLMRRCADEQRAALCDARREKDAARRRMCALEKELDDATRKLAAAVDETEKCRVHARKHEETADARLRDLTRSRAALLKATDVKKKKKDAETNTTAFAEAFADVLSERYASGVRDGDASREKATRDVLERERRLADASRDAAHARASDAEARVARLAASLERTREAAAAERKRAAAMSATRDADAAASKAKTLAAKKALAAAETREAVFRARLEAMALALASRVRETDFGRSSEPSKEDESPVFFGAEVRVESRVKSARRDAAFEKKKRMGRASKPRTSSSALATRLRSRASSPERRVPAPAATLRSSLDPSSGGRDENAPVRGGNRHDDWLPEVRPPPRMLA